MRIFHDGLENRSQLMLRQASKAIDVRFGTTDTVAPSPQADTFTRTTPVTMAFDPRIEVRLKHHSVDDMTQQIGAVMNLMRQELAADNIDRTEHKVSGFNSDDFVVYTKSGTQYRISNNASNGSPDQNGHLTIARVILGADSNTHQELRQEIRLTYGLQDGKPDLNAWSGLYYYENTHNRPSGIAGGMESRHDTQSLSPQNIQTGAKEANALYFETELTGLLGSALAALTPNDGTSDARSLLDPSRKWRQYKPSETPVTGGRSNQDG